MHFPFQPIDITPGQHLLDHHLRLIKIIFRRNGLGNLGAVFRRAGIMGGVHDGLKQGRVGIGQFARKLLATGKRAAGMALPDVLGQDMDKADALIDRALIKRIGRQVAVEVAGAQVGDHLRRRHHADLNILIRINAELGHVIAQ